MGRGSQIFWYLNSAKAATKDEQYTVYTHLEITSDLKKYRREYRRALKKLKAEDQHDMFEDNL